jgi:methylmalonyl-CoA mutase, C-terminal domain
MEGTKKIRVLMAKSGTDGHVRGAIVVSRALQEAGMEVILTGLYQTPERIVETAIQEDVDVIGVSIHCGSHKPILKEIMKRLREERVKDVIVVVGGIIPDGDREELLNMGVAGVFTPGASTDRIVQFIKERVSGISQ